MEIALALLLITVASALDHHDVYSWSRRREDFKAAASRSAAPIKVKETRAPRPTPQPIRRSSSPFASDALDSARRHAFEDESRDLWSPVTVRTRQDLTRENRAIESNLKNVIGRPAKVEQYQYFTSFPYGGDVDAILEHTEQPRSTFLSKDNRDHGFLDHNAEEVDWSAQDIFEKDTQDEEEEQVVEEEEEREERNMQEFLDEIKRKKLSGDLEGLAAGAHRQGRRRKLTSQQQGELLVETLRKKRNHTSDHRGHSSNLQSGLMDMLGRSMFKGTEMGWKYRSTSSSSEGRSQVDDVK